MSKEQTKWLEKTEQMVSDESEVIHERIDELEESLKELKKRIEDIESLLKIYNIVPRDALRW